ncbi:MAG: YlbF family regulator [Clostridia bacterium]|nr:YlbF family regulator [Clostridia bacterium]
MLVYDKAYELARALSNSDAYKDLVAKKQKLQENEANYNMLTDFRQLDLEISMDKLAGKEVSQEQLRRWESLYQLVSANPTIRDFMEAEMRFARLMSDIQKIISEAVPEWFEKSSG